MEKERKNRSQKSFKENARSAGDYRKSTTKDRNGNTRKDKMNHSGENRKFKEVKGFKADKDFKDSKNFKGEKNFKDSKNFKGEKGLKDSKGFKGEKNFKDSKNFKGEKGFKDSKNFKSEKSFKDNKNFKGDKNFKDGKNSKENKADKGTKNSKWNSPCPIYRKCGSCCYLNLTYQDQLKKKQKLVEGLLGKYGRVNQIIGMEDPHYYRNKVHAVFDRDARGNVICGTYEAESHRVVSVENCLLEDKKAQDIIHTIRDLCKSFKIKIYDEDTEYGLLRHVLIRRGFHSGEIMVILVLASPILPSKNNFVKALRTVHPEITSVVINVNDKQTSMVLGDRDIPLYGPAFIKDTLCETTFRISAKSFYQVNPVQTEVLYNTAMKYAELKGTERVLDAYCGIGTISLVAARHAKEVIGVELNADAVKDARLNARENQIKNASFYQGDAGEFLMKLAEQGEKLDTVFMDPPRSGSSKEFIDSVVTCAPEKVVYVSCHPETLARDLAIFAKKGYRVRKIQPVDMFPWTEHVETVVLLQRKNM